ncbi:cyanase [Brachybacterium sp. J144]|uniref:cyanase n=1 Tax=Brachybacterium sp. J144 TaxID=3116487 RepID=UPI002E79016C|nr:cyanase [Brachybacterium sp. J144]MEE1651970.1 cyanase [Brachybacterium sp. J144]
MDLIEKRTAGEIIDARRREKGLTWAQLAEATRRPVVWLTSAVLGSHPVPAEVAATLAEQLELEDELVEALRRQPYRTIDPELLSDPTIYRFQELIQVYGPALKALIHEEFGDGIMSAINCSIDLRRGSHPGGDRVVLTIDGKFLSYDWAASEG